MSYGVLPTGYARRPLAVILADIEARMRTEFGSGVIQTPQSPFGQLNGLFADLIAEIDERNLDLYQSYDPDQAEGVRLDTLARIRLLDRGLLTDEQFRRAVTNQGQGRIDIQDLARALTGLPGVTFAKVYVDETGEVTNERLDRATVSVAVIGGADEDIALTMRRYIVPGIGTYGNTMITSDVDGFCRSVTIIRPTPVEVDLDVVVRRTSDRQSCPPPSLSAIETVTASRWLETRSNGTDPSFYTIRSIIERQWDNVEVISVQGRRDEVDFGLNQPVLIGFMEIAHLNIEAIDA